jgi:hypothetical protein
MVADLGSQNLINWQDGTALRFATSTQAYGTFNERMRLDTSGNLGLGVTPSAWSLSGLSALQVKNGSLYGYQNEFGAQVNCYYASGGWKYIATAAASQYVQVSGAHQWFTAPSGTADNAISFTQAMTLDASGNLGVGTTSPNATGSAGTAIHINGSTKSELHLTNNATGTSSSDGANIALSDSDLYINNRESGFTAFFNNGSERARITSGGDLLVGTTAVLPGGGQSGGQGININGGSASKNIVIQNSTDGAIYLAKVSGYTNGNYIDLYVDGSRVGLVSTNGTTTTYATTSDYRLKHDIQTMTGALAKVAALKPVTYKWNADDSESQGFIAHELQEVVPECVTGEKDAVDKDGKPVYQGIDTSFLVATLTAAIQEQQALINSLKARLDAANL